MNKKRKTDNKFLRFGVCPFSIYIININYNNMKKNRLIRFPGLLKRYKKNLMIMKWCIAFICLFTLNLSANVYSQKNIVSLDLSDVSIEQFVKVVKQQTSLKFMYNSSLIRQAGKISVKVENKELKDVLSMVLGKVNLEYEFFNNVILIRVKDEKKSKKILTFIF